MIAPTDYERNRAREAYDHHRGRLFAAIDLGQYDRIALHAAWLAHYAEIIAEAVAAERGGR